MASSHQTFAVNVLFYLK